MICLESKLTCLQEMLLTNLLLVDENTGQLKRSAAMLFHPNQERFVSGAYIKLGFFAGEDDDLVLIEYIRLQLWDRSIFAKFCSITC